MNNRSKEQEVLCVEGFSYSIFKLTNLFISLVSERFNACYKLVNISLNTFIYLVVVISYLYS